MSKQTITEIKKGQVGTGLLIENDGYISIHDKANKPILEAIELGQQEGKRNIPFPFVVSAVFQKYGIENANGRIYPENILKREVEKYQQAILEKRAYGECYTPDALCLTKNGWKSIVDVKEGDEILTLNVETNEIEIQKVTFKTESDWDGEIYHVYSNISINDKVTPNHGYPIYKIENGKLLFDKFITVEELSKKKKHSNIWLPITQEVGENCTIFDVSCANFEKEAYKGKVYCVEVPNHTWYVMQNGKCHWTKNCNHPESSAIDLGRLCMNIIELHWEGHTLVGKIELPISDGFRFYGIVSTLADMIAQWIISGLRVGVSSRGLGSVTQQMGRLVVGDDYEIVCWDVVAQPSTPNAWIETSSDKLQPYIESQSKNGEIIKEDKYSEFENWLND